jgi:hypothetical protein
VGAGGARGDRAAGRAGRRRTLVIDVATGLPFERAAEGLATLAAGQAHGKIVVTIAEYCGLPGWL